MKYLDFRSDTVTKPTTKMLLAIQTASLGDDVYEDDPTVKVLEHYGAELLGKEAALFVPSGTFANQLAIMTHTNRGDEIIVSETCHIIDHEVGGTALLSGVNLRTVPYTENIMAAEAIGERIREEDIHYPKTALICIENAHSSGRVMQKQTMEAIRRLADEKGIPIHLDGARFFNAAVELKLDFQQFASYADSINICLSKGLCAPIGSLLLGSKTFIEKARKNRKLMGGGMRQVGVLAAPGLIALKEMVRRIEEDHHNALYLAEQLDQIEDITVMKDRLDINMVFFKLPESIIAEDILVAKLLENNIKINDIENGEYRLMTQRDISRADIDKFCGVLDEILNLKVKV